MNNRLNLIHASIVCLFTASCGTAEEPSAQQPNIIIIYADDLGYGDVQSYNPDRGKIPTPNIDRLADQGMRFTDAHSSSAVCTPSRYTLLTGRYHWRSRQQQGIVPVFGPPLITPDRLTIAGLVKQKAYHTPLSVNDEWKDKSGISMYADLVMETDGIVGQVLEALEKSGAANNTLVIFTSDNGCAPYIGNTTLEEAADTTYKDWSQYAPRSWHQLSDLPVNAMEEKGHFPSGPLRGYKSDVWEGGHRVPFIVRWPGKVNPGSISNQLVHQADLMSTLADIIGVSLPPDAGEDSFSLLPLLYGEDNPVREHAVSTSLGGTPGLRTGPWKLILGEGSGRGGWTPGGDEKPVQLYHLDNDLGETENLADKFPERVEEMQLTMEKIISEGRSTPGPKQENDVEVIRY